MTYSTLISTFKSRHLFTAEDKHIEMDIPLTTLKAMIHYIYTDRLEKKTNISDLVSASRSQYLTRDDF